MRININICVLYVLCINIELTVKLLNSMHLTNFMYAMLILYMGNALNV